MPQPAGLTLSNQRRERAWLGWLLTRAEKNTSLSNRVVISVVERPFDQRGSEPGGIGRGTDYHAPRCQIDARFFGGGCAIGFADGIGHQRRERSRLSPATPGGFQAQHLGDVFGEIEGGFHEYGFMANQVPVKSPAWRGRARRRRHAGT